MLYELATGKRPFTGDTSLSVLSAILKDTPRPVAELRPELPRDFARIVRAEQGSGTSLGAIPWASDGKAIDIVLPPDAGNVWRYPIVG